jgi:hypothetical protein
MARIHIAVGLRSRATQRLLLSSLLSLALLVAARAERGDASLGVLLVIPIFALAHHATAVLSACTRRGPDALLADVPILGALTCAYTAASTVVVLVLLTYWYLLGEIECRRRTLLTWDCFDPRDMRWVLFQAVAGSSEALLVWKIYKDARASAPSEPAGDAYTLLPWVNTSIDGTARGSGSEGDELQSAHLNAEDDEDDNPPSAGVSRAV